MRYINFNFQTVTSRILSHANGVDPESTTWTCSCPPWEVADMRTEGAKTVGLKYVARETYLSLSWIQICFIYWKVGLIVFFNFFSFLFFSSLHLPFFSLPLPLLFLCAGKQDAAEQILSEFLLFRYTRVYIHTCTNTHTFEGALSTDWLALKAADLSCTWSWHGRSSLVHNGSHLLSLFVSFVRIKYSLRWHNPTQPGCLINGFPVMLLLWHLRVTFVFLVGVQCPKSLFQPPHL